MKRTFVRLVQLSIALCCASPVFASQGYYQGTVQAVEIVGGIAIITLVNGNGVQSCTAGEFWFDPTTDPGHSFLALAITAKAIGTTVYVQGNGTCTTAWPQSNTEQAVTVSWSG